MGCVPSPPASLLLSYHIPSIEGAPLSILVWGVKLSGFIPHYILFYIYNLHSKQYLSESYLCGELELGLNLYKATQPEHPVAEVLKNAGTFHAENSALLLGFFQLMARLIQTVSLVSFKYLDLYKLMFWHLYLFVVFCRPSNKPGRLSSFILLF